MAAPVFIFDGDCAFCSSCAAFILRWIPTPAQVVAWQARDLDRLGVSRANCAEAVQWVEPGGPHAPVAGPVAIAALLRSSRGLWRAAGWLLGWRPMLAAAWPVYRWVSRNRHRMPGGTRACALPVGHVE